jgi:uncharacterized protein YbjQ (UPF0145 family)
MKRKIVSAVVITVIVALIIVLYASGIVMGVLESNISPMFLILVVGAALAVVGALIYNLIERIKEIKEEERMILVNTDYITGKELETLSIVKGSTVHSKNVGKDILSGLKTLVGGEIVAYTEMMDEARAIATKRMVEEAEALGADGVINIRYATSAIMQGSAEVIVYGTAVKFK